MKKVTMFLAFMLCAFASNAANFGQNGLPTGASLGDLLYWNSTSNQWVTSSGWNLPDPTTVSGQCVKSSGTAWTTSSCGGTAASLSGLTAPNADNTIATGIYQTILTPTYAGATGKNAFSISQTAADTGSGVLLYLSTPSTSSVHPLTVVNGSNTLLDFAGATTNIANTNIYLDGSGSIRVGSITVPSIFSATASGSSGISLIATSTSSPHAAKLTLGVGTSGANGGAIIMTSGHTEFKSATPTILSGFGSSPSMGTGSSDHAMYITAGTSPSTSGVVNFGASWSNDNKVPGCVANSNYGDAIYVSAVSATQVTVTVGAGISGGSLVTILCF